MTPERERLETRARMYRHALEKLGEAARDLARAETLAYSKAHPRRTVTFVAAMGSTCLHVSRGGCANWKGASDYQLGGYDSEVGQPVEFMRELGAMESEFGFGFALAGSVRIVCKGGELIEEMTDW